MGLAWNPLSQQPNSVAFRAKQDGFVSVQDSSLLPATHGGGEVAPGRGDREGHHAAESDDRAEGGGEASPLSRCQGHHRSLQDRQSAGLDRHRNANGNRRKRIENNSNRD